MSWARVLTAVRTFMWTSVGLSSLKCRCPRVVERSLRTMTLLPSPVSRSVDLASLYSVDLPWATACRAFMLMFVVHERWYICRLGQRTLTKLGRRSRTLEGRYLWGSLARRIQTYVYWPWGRMLAPSSIRSRLIVHDRESHTYEYKVFWIHIILHVGALLV